ncbi:MAG: cysteine--tRNA ligase [Candidatus Rokubacteria bacterium]|nr:cysteine--tRNA ligase [Candidatus Rokubacteria bacterium]
MPIRIYNRLTRQMEPLETRRPGEVGMYSCGVTPYDLCHVGHARSAIVFDVMQRYLRARGYRVVFVRNFTDVDDKIIRRANTEGVSASEISERYIAEFRADMASIGVHGADVEPKATEHIGEMVALIERLVAKGVAYVVDGDVYFEVRRFADYGKLSGKNLDDLIAGARVEVDERKRDPRDFALWKSTKPGEPSWPSPWGPGRPGWHIECSAMSMKYLGESFDLHGGGDDLIFPHHECEIAQSEAATGVRFARYWVHNGMVNLGAEKMSKSLGNILTIKEIAKRGPADALRLWLLNTHYANPIDFSEERLAENARALERFHAVIGEALKSESEAFFDVPPPTRFGGPAPWTVSLGGIADAALHATVAAACERFEQAMDDDFGTPEARAVLFGLARDLDAYRRDGGDAGPFAAGVRTLVVLGRALGLFERLPDVAGPPPEVERLVAERVEARTRRDWKRSDALRDEIQRLGWAVEDTPAGPRVTRRTP